MVSSEVQQQTSNIQNYEASNLTAQQKELFESLGSSYSDLFDNTSNSISDAINRQNQIIQALGAGVNRHVTITLNRDQSALDVNNSVIDVDLLRSQSDMFKQTLEEALKNKSEIPVENKQTGQRTIIYRQSQNQNSIVNNDNNGVIGGRLSSIPNNTSYLSSFNFDNSEQSYIPVDESRSAILGSRKIDDISNFDGLMSQQQSITGNLSSIRIKGLTGGVNTKQTTPLVEPATNPLSGLSGGLFSTPKINNEENSILSLDEAKIAGSGLGLFLTGLFGKLTLTGDNLSNLLTDSADSDKQTSTGLKSLADILMRDADAKRMADVTGGNKNASLSDIIKRLTFNKLNQRGMAKKNPFAEALKGLKGAKNASTVANGVKGASRLGAFLKLPTLAGLAGAVGVGLLGGAAMLGAAKIYTMGINKESKEAAQNTLDITKNQIKQQDRNLETSLMINDMAREQMAKEVAGEKVNAFGEAVIKHDLEAAKNGNSPLSMAQNRKFADTVSNISNDQRKEMSIKESQQAADILTKQAQDEYLFITENVKVAQNKQLKDHASEVKRGIWDNQEFWLTDSEIYNIQETMDVRVLEGFVKTIDKKIGMAQEAKHTRAVNALQQYRSIVNSKYVALQKSQDRRLKYLEEAGKYQEQADGKKLQESSTHMTPEENAKQMENDNMGAVLEGVKEDMSQSEYDYLKTQLESGDEESKRVAIETIKRYDEAKRNREAEQIPAEGNLDMVGVETAPEQTMMDTSNQLEQQDQMKREQEQAEKEEQKHKEDEQIQANKQLVESVKQVVENSTEQTKAIKETQQVQNDKPPIQFTTILPPSTNNMPISTATIPT